MGEARVILVRHGHTDFNDHGQERIRGWLDVPLDKEGVANAHAAAAKLNGIQAHEIVSADLQRSARTAHIIASKTGVPIRIDPRLRPWNMGVLGGKDLADVEDVINHHLAHPDQPIPGGESFDEFITRWRAGLHRMIGISSELEKPVIGVTSHSNLLSVDTALSNIPPTTVHRGEPKPGDIMSLDVDI